MMQAERKVELIKEIGLIWRPLRQIKDQTQKKYKTPNQDLPFVYGAHRCALLVKVKPWVAAFCLMVCGDEPVGQVPLGRTKKPTEKLYTQETSMAHLRKKNNLSVPTPIVKSPVQGRPDKSEGSVPWLKAFN